MPAAPGGVEVGGVVTHPDPGNSESEIAVGSGFRVDDSETIHPRPDGTDGTLKSCRIVIYTCAYTVQPRGLSPSVSASAPRTVCTMLRL